MQAHLLENITNHWLKSVSHPLVKDKLAGKRYHDLSSGQLAKAITLN